MWECPTSAIPRAIWAVLELFWLCYTRTPGFSGWAVQRAAYPDDGPPLAQSSWIMWAFQVMEAEFYALQADLQGEREHARGLEQMHRQVQHEGRGQMKGR